MAPRAQGREQVEVAVAVEVAARLDREGRNEGRAGRAARRARRGQQSGGRRARRGGAAPTLGGGALTDEVLARKRIVSDGSDGALVTVRPAETA